MLMDSVEHFHLVMWNYKSIIEQMIDKGRESATWSMIGMMREWEEENEHLINSNS